MSNGVLIERERAKHLMTLLENARNREVPPLGPDLLAVITNLISSTISNSVSPVLITEHWQKRDDENLVYGKCRRLWYDAEKGKYEIADWNEDEYSIFSPFTTECPHGIGDRVFAAFRGRWECLERPSFRTGVLQETFVENEQETGRARVRLHVADYENSSEENGAKIKLGDEIVTAYCTKADPGDTIPSGAKVDLWFVNNRWDMVNMTCIGEE